MIPHIQNPVCADRPAATRTSAVARLAIAASAAYWLLSAAVVVVNPQWNPLTRQLSEYALGRHGWLQIAAFLASALAYGALAVAVRDRVCGLAARIGLVVLCACALGSVGVGVFVTDPMTTPADAFTTHALLHVVFGAGALVLLPVAALLITRSLARNHRPGSSDVVACVGSLSCRWPDCCRSGYPSSRALSRPPAGPTGSCSSPTPRG